VTKYNVYLFFLDNEKKPSKIFLGKVDATPRFLSFEGMVSEFNNPENEMRISEGISGDDFIKFCLSTGGQKYQVELHVFEMPTSIKSIKTGIFGFCYEADKVKPDDLNLFDDYNVIASFIPNARDS
jgi:hypothetical protein